MIIKKYALFVQILQQSLVPVKRNQVHISSNLAGYQRIFIKKRSIPNKKLFVVWKGMNIKELASSMNLPTRDVKEALYRVVGTSQRLQYNTEIEDISILRDVAKLCGGTINEKISTPEIVRIDKDVYRRNINEHADRLKSRPPVVTIMGHVDHGKTTLLDSLRSSRIVDSEFGGITQHIGAFKVSLSDVSDKVYDPSRGHVVTFLDTPGHAAFSAMRSRGAHCTDIVVLVVAIDDGIMPQTLESVRFAHEAKVPIVVAINKIDRIWKSLDDFKSNKNNSPFKSVISSLSSIGLQTEENGGNIQCIPISALKKWNLGILQESILALAEIMNIKSDYEGLCESVVLEANMVENLGKVATILVQQGRLKCGSVFVAGNTFIKVRTIKSDKGDNIKEAKPGDPVEVTGWKGNLPMAGDVMIEVKTESIAREVIEYRQREIDQKKTEMDYENYEKSMAAYKASYKNYLEKGFVKGIRYVSDRPNIEDFIHNERIINGVEIPQVNLVIKTDVHGSLEAIEKVLEAASKSCANQCLLKIAHASVGNVTDNDLQLAVSNKCIIYLFNLPNSFATYRNSGVDIRHFNVIYHLFDNLKEHLTSILPIISECEIFGEAEVLQLFDIDDRKKKIPVCGSKCFKGTLFKNASEYQYRIVKLTNDGKNFKIVQKNLKCKSLRHLKADVDIVRKGNECGVILVNEYNDYVTPRVGDIIQCFTMKSTKQDLVWELGF